VAANAQQQTSKPYMYGDLCVLQTWKYGMQGDGGVLKKLLVAGEGWELPQKDDKVYGEIPQSFEGAICAE
jgi:hypothetical protein